MASPASQLTRQRHQWVNVIVELGFVLSLAGLILLTLNPFWRLNASGFLDQRVFWWNGAGQVLTGAGFLTLSLGIVGLGAGLLSRCFPGRPFWPYLFAALIVFGVVVWAGLDGFTRDFIARFEWSSADGFSVFRLDTSEATIPNALPSGNWLWRALVGIQVQPLLRGYFRLLEWERVQGHVGVTVVRVVPIAWPVALGREGETVEDPDQTPLMQAAAVGDIKKVKQLLAAGAEVNARDQSGQTALIIACRTPRVPPELVKALLAAGADVNTRSRNDYTALSWATTRGNTEVIQLLRRSGARP
jgi:Ankyrin repeats (3 copies)